MVTSTYPKYQGDPDPGFVHEVSKELASLGLKMYVVAPHHAISKDKEDMDGVAVHRFRYMLPKLKILTGGAGMPSKLQRSFFAKMELLPFLLSSFVRGLNVCEAYKVDLIHAHWFFPSGLIGVLIKKVTCKPLVLTGYGVEFFLVQRKYRVMLPFLRWIVANADECVFISSAVKKTADDMGIFGERIIPYGVDVNKFVPMSLDSHTVDALKLKYGIPGGKIVFAVGRLVERKGFRFLIESMTDVLKSAGDVVLVIAGEGPEKDNLKGLIHKLKLDDKAKLIGKVSQSDLPLLYNICDVFVLPSIIDSSGDQEGFGIVLCEAMACERAVIGTKVGGILDIVEDGYNGILVEQKSSKELSDAILQVIFDKELCRKLGINGRKTVISNFSYERIGYLYRSLYSSLLMNDSEK